MQLPGLEPDEEGKHGSFVIVFSIWSFMTSAGIVSLPWAFQSSGILLGIGVTFVAFVMSTYTCLLVVRTAGNDLDYTETVKKQFGNKGQAVAMFFIILNLYVPILLFQQLLAQSLFPIILAVMEPFTHNNKQITFTPDWNEFSYSWTCVIILVITLIMTSRRDLKIFIKMNSYGVVFVCCTLLSILCIGFYSLSNTEYTFNITQYNEHVSSGAPYEAYINLASTNYPPLMGILGGGFYFHNISLPVIRNARNPEKNVRNILLGYFLVFITYVLCGTLGYFGFVGMAFEAMNPMGPKGIEQNCLNMFTPTSTLGTFMRVFVFLQLLVVNALIFACERAQILLLVTGK